MCSRTARALAPCGDFQLLKSKVRIKEHPSLLLLSGLRAFQTCRAPPAAPQHAAPTLPSWSCACGGGTKGSAASIQENETVLCSRHSFHTEIRKTWES